MGIVNASSGIGKTGLATLAYPFAALGTGVRAGVANAVGAPKPTDTAADAVAAFGASGVDGQLIHPVARVVKNRRRMQQKTSHGCSFLTVTDRTAG